MLGYFAFQGKKTRGLSNVSNLITGARRKAQKGWKKFMVGKDSEWLYWWSWRAGLIYLSEPLKVKGERKTVMHLYASESQMYSSQKNLLSSIWTIPNCYSFWSNDKAIEADRILIQIPLTKTLNQRWARAFLTTHLSFQLSAYFQKTILLRIIFKKQIYTFCP